ncbi:hypothetical protein OAO87_01700 [bacterium]|nr:hypothetical protein [bacterium]
MASGPFSCASFSGSSTRPPRHPGDEVTSSAPPRLPQTHPSVAAVRSLTGPHAPQPPAACSLLTGIASFTSRKVACALTIAAGSPGSRSAPRRRQPHLRRRCAEGPPRERPRLALWPAERRAPAAGAASVARHAHRGCARDRGRQLVADRPRRHSLLRRCRAGAQRGRGESSRTSLCGPPSGARRPPVPHRPPVTRTVGARVYVAASSSRADRALCILSRQSAESVLITVARTGDLCA